MAMGTERARGDDAGNAATQGNELEWNAVFRHVADQPFDKNIGNYSAHA